MPTPPILAPPMRRVCVWCIPPHDIGAVCPCCGSIRCETICSDLWLCDECRMTWHLPVDAPITHGMCPAAGVAFGESATPSVPDLAMAMSVFPVSEYPRGAMRGLLWAIPLAFIAWGLFWWAVTR